MSTLPPPLPPNVRRSEKASGVPRRGGKYELPLLIAQGEFLERELTLRKTVVRHTEDIIALFNRLYPKFERRSPVFPQYAARLQAVCEELQQMRQNERMAAYPKGLPVPAVRAEERAALMENARKAAANAAYFSAFNIYNVLVTNLHRVLAKLSQEDRLLAPQIQPAIQALEGSWKKIAPLGGIMGVRRVARPDPDASDDDVKAAFEIWNELLRRNPDDAYLHSLAPHQSQNGRLRLLYFCVGGLGDALLQTPCVAALRRRFDPCEIVFVHSRGVVRSLFAGNRTVESAIHVQDDLLLKLPSAAKLLGIFDLVLESRFVIWAEFCRHSRIRSLEDREWVESTQRTAESFAPYLERFPHYSNLFARIVSPRMLLDVHGMSTGLAVNVTSPLFMYPEERDANFTSEIGLDEGTYVTVHDGFDEGFGKQMGISRCTKQLPVETWRTVIANLQQRGLRVVQVGAPNEPALPGVDVDLRGRTSLSQLCFVLKGAAVHVDTEGGIVHMARAVHKKSVVCFGPTSVDFWGYPVNANLCSDEYVDCWWINPDWMARAPIQQKKSAMEGFEASEITRVVLQEINAARVQEYRIDDIRYACCASPSAETVAPGSLAGEGSVRQYTDRDALLQEFALEQIGDRCASAVSARIAVVGSWPEQLIRILESYASAEVFEIGNPAEPTSRPKERRREPQLYPYVSRYNLPANSDSYDVVIARGVIEGSRSPQQVISEMRRLLKVGGVAVIVFTGVDGTSSDQSVHELRSLLTGDTSVVGNGDKARRGSHEELRGGRITRLR
jgi:ADP-heptose:LPS heptosyltransferase